MKKLLFFLFVSFVCYNNLYSQESKNEQILLLTDGIYLLPTVEYQIIFPDGKIIDGESNSKGIITVKAMNFDNYRLKLDLKPLFDFEEDPPEFTMTDKEAEPFSFEIFYLKHPEDEEKIEIIDGHKYTLIEHSNDCNYLEYDVTLKTGRNYILFHTRRPMSGISE